MQGVRVSSGNDSYSPWVTSLASSLSLSLRCLLKIPHVPSHWSALTTDHCSVEFCFNYVMGAASLSYSIFLITPSPLQRGMAFLWLLSRKVCGRGMWCVCMCKLIDYVRVYQMVSIVLWVAVDSLEGRGRSICMSVTEEKVSVQRENRASGSRKGDSFPSVVPVCWGVERPQICSWVGWPR